MIGFAGLSVREMDHSLELDGRRVWTWCAWDTLFLPELIDAEANVSSRCPVTGKEITLAVVHYFASREAGEWWTKEHEGTFLISVDDAYELGRLTNRAQFGPAMASAQR